MSAVVPTLQFASVVYGDGVELDDPAEAYHEAAKLYPSSAGWQTRGIQLLEQHSELRHSIERAGRRHPHRERVTLPRASWPDVPLGTAVGTRRSRPLRAHRRGSAAITDLRDVATILAATQGLAPDDGGRRLIPSAGALYPLELYVLAVRASTIQPAVYHYDPLDHCLERLDGRLTDLSEALVDPTLADSASFLVVLTGVFWRSRFKYGLRGYRFTLLEAGHAAQNALLAAAALGLGAVPLGGFYDARLDALVGADGVDESVVYALAFGGPDGEPE